MEHFSEKFRRNLILKRCLKVMRDYEARKKKARALDRKMDQIYAKNLMKKSFFPWRTYIFLNSDSCIRMGMPILWGDRPKKT